MGSSALLMALRIEHWKKVSAGARRADLGDVLGLQSA